MIRRRGRSLTVYSPGLLIGFTLWRRGALSLLWRGGQRVPIQIVIGDWWKAYPGHPKRGTNRASGA